MSMPIEKSPPPAPRPWRRALSSLPQAEAWRVFLGELEEHLEALYAHAEHASYLLYRDKVDPDLVENHAMARAVYGDEGLFELLHEARDRYDEPELARRTELLHQFFLRERVKARPEVQRLSLEISKLYVHFEPRLADGRRGKGRLSQLCRTSEDRGLRKEAWFAIHSVGERAAALVRRLAECRNEAARDMGFPSWMDLIYPTYGLTGSFVAETIETLSARLRPLYDRVGARLADEVGLDALEPWDLDWARDRLLAPPADAFPAEEAIPALDATLARLGGRRDPADVPLTVAEIPLGGACFDIHIPKDLRILVNPREGLIFRWVLFHEYGHALHHGSNRQQGYVLQRGDPSALREGMADLLATYATEPEALAANLGGLDAARLWWGRVEIRRIFDLFRQMYQVQTENALYEQEGALHGDLHMAASERFAIRIPAEAPQAWAVRITLAEHPNYMQDYMFAQMVAAQCREALVDRGIAEGETIPVLAETLYGPGARRPWSEKIEDFCAAPLSIDPLCRRFERAFEAW